MPACNVSICAFTATTAAKWQSWLVAAIVINIIALIGPFLIASIINMLSHVDVPSLIFPVCPSTRAGPCPRRARAPNTTLAADPKSFSGDGQFHALQSSYCALALSLLVYLINYFIIICLSVL